MRVREIVFYNFRAFRGLHRISFVDPLTDQVRPVTVIAGTNGTGKTTILEVIAGLLGSLLKNYNPYPAPKDPDVSERLLSEVYKNGAVAATFELDPTDLGSSNDLSDKRLLTLAVGQHPASLPDLLAVSTSWGYMKMLELSGQPRILISPPDTFDQLRASIRQVNTEAHAESQVGYGGMVCFPHARHPGSIKSHTTTIKKPDEEFEYVYRFIPSEKWEGSLEQLWVWQNYLDLEQRNQGRENLKPFIETVEEILGDGRRISIQQGRVRITAPWKDEEGKPVYLSLDQLPSGEQQVLLLMGELARRRRPGAIIAVDEPETSLHPTLQRMLVHYLRTFARTWDCQLILATHSLEIMRTVHESELINLDHLDEPTPTSLSVP